MILTGKEIKALAEFVGLTLSPHVVVSEDELETEIHISITKDKRKIATYYDYPEEGCIDLSDF